MVVGLLSLLTVLAYLTAWRRGAGGRLHRAWYWTACRLRPAGEIHRGGVATRAAGAGPLPARAADDLGAAPRGEAALRPAERGRRRPHGGILASRGLFASHDTLSVFARLALAAYGLVFYLWRTLVPGPLSPIYPLVLPVHPFTPVYLLPAAVVILITAAVVAARRRWPAGWVAWGAYVVLVAPVLGLAHSGPQIVADRYSYLACVPSRSSRARASRGAGAGPRSARPPRCPACRSSAPRPSSC